jgi:hypothetical protein
VGKGKFAAGAETQKKIKKDVPKPKAAAGAAVPKEDRYYAVEGRPLYIGEAQGPTRGIDGTVNSNKRIPDGIIIEAVNLQDGKVASKGTLESDGFFMISKLTSGKYELRLKGAKNPPAPIKVEISQGQDWVSGIKWEWDNK